jgi:hypothetical protein
MEKKSEADGKRNKNLIPKQTGFKPEITLLAVALVRVLRAV